MKKWIVSTNEQQRGSVVWTKNNLVSLSSKPVRSETFPSDPSRSSKDIQRKQIRGQSITSSKHSSRKSVNEIEQEDPMNEFRPVSVMRIKRNVNQMEYHKNNSMKIPSDQNREFIPLYSRNYPENNRALKYRFPSKKNPLEKQGKISPAVWNCFKVFGCLFAITACSLGIAALIFANLALRNIFISINLFLRNFNSFRFC